jgi:multidrug efflux pump subunit AcrA (membrane-fusion protein)
MTPSFDSARLAELPPDLRALFETQRAMLEAERVRADREHRRAEHELAARLHVESELAASEETVERLQLLVKEYERARFGKRSEKFDPDQLQLVLEDIEIAIAEAQEREEDRARRSGRVKSMDAHKLRVLLVARSQTTRPKVFIRPRMVLASDWRCPTRRLAIGAPLPIGLGFCGC